MRIQILCDSWCDFTPSERISSTFRRISATVTVGGRSFTDGDDFRPAELLACLRDGQTPELVPPTARDFLAAADDAAEELYILTASAALDGQYDAAFQARRLLLGEQPERRIHVFNTRSAGVGELLAARRVSQLQRSGDPFRQIVERVEAEILANRCCLLPGTPAGLRQLGAAVRPGRGIYRMSLEGCPVWLCGGLTDRAAEKRLVRRLGGAGKPGGTCLIAHTGCPERARRVAQLLQQQKRFSSILLTETGVRMTLLLGPGGLALAYD